MPIQVGDILSIIEKSGSIFGPAFAGGGKKKETAAGIALAAKSQGQMAVAMMQQVLNDTESDVNDFRAASMMSVMALGLFMGSMDTIVRTLGEEELLNQPR